MADRRHHVKPRGRLAAGSVGAAVVCLAAGLGTGCAGPTKGPVVFYLDGAGWYSSAGSVEAGLRQAGYKGAFQRFSWSAYLGPAHDHLITAHSKSVARRLARKVEQFHKKDPTGAIHLMGLSAGTAVILSALEQLRGDVQVETVVLFSSSVSSKHDLTRAMKHVRRRLYATYSPHDGILRTLVVNADGLGGPPAGTVGFRTPPRGGAGTQEAYRKVVNLPWQASYVGFDWNGGHTSVTNSKFVASVIAPRILHSEPYPLDRPVMARHDALEAGMEP